MSGNADIQRPRQASSNLPLLVWAALAGLLWVCPTPCDAQIRFTGVNIAGAEFGESVLPGTHGTHYRYPMPEEVTYFLGKGMNTFRLPFRWERLQRAALDPLHGAGPGPTGELDRIDAFVNQVTGLGGYVILEPHNFARYFPSGSGNFQESTNGRLGNDVPDAWFADFWGKVADHYKDNPRVIFNLMNEPTAIDTDDWVSAANAAIAAIRAAGAKNLIQVPGNRWTGAWTWHNSGGFVNGIAMGRSNADALLDIVDPIDNFVIEVHQYMDFNGSGQNESINNNDPLTGVIRVSAFTNWLRANGLKGFLGEFAVPNSLIGSGPSQIGDETIRNLLDYLEANDDVWTGWAWWAAGPWWAGGPGQPAGQTPYMFLLDPANLLTTPIDKPAMGVLDDYFAQELPGDYNRDGRVDGGDYVTWRNSLGQTGTLLAADSNIDGLIDLDDYETWKSNYGDSLDGFGAGGLTRVPEPTAAALMVVGGTMLGFFRRRSRPVAGRR